MKLKNVSMGLSVIALGILSSCEGGKAKKAPSANNEPVVEAQSSETEQDTSTAAEPTLAEACAKILADSEALTKGLQEICLASENGAKQIKTSMLVDFSGEGVRVVKGGDSENGGITRDVSKLLAVRSSAELKSLICATHRDFGQEASPRNDLFDVFYVRYLHDDSTVKQWIGGIQTGEISANTVDSTICAPEVSEGSLSVLQVIVAQ
jgi:hypothetical protein